MDLIDKSVRGICSVAQLRKEHGDYAIYCEKGCGKDPEEHDSMMQIKSGEVCVATKFFSTGHSYLSSTVELEKMKECSDREISKS